MCQSDGHGNCGGAVWGGGGGRGRRTLGANNGLHWGGGGLCAGDSDWVVIVGSRGAGWLDWSSWGRGGDLAGRGGLAGGDWVVVVCSGGGGWLDWSGWGRAALGAAHWVVVVSSGAGGGWLDGCSWGRAGGNDWVVVVLSSGCNGSSGSEEGSVTHLD